MACSTPEGCAPARNMTKKKQYRATAFLEEIEKILREPATFEAIRTIAQDPKNTRCLEAIKVMLAYTEGQPTAKVTLEGRVELIYDGPRQEQIPSGGFESFPALLPAGGSSGSDAKGLPSGDDRHIEPGPSE